jgi:hypothetical protein
MPTDFDAIAERLRNQCASLRRKPTPLADLIPLLQEAADALATAAVAAPERLTYEDKKMLTAMADEYERLAQRWREATAGSQEVANLHATYQARERALGRLAEGGLFRRLVDALAASPGQGLPGDDKKELPPLPVTTHHIWIGDDAADAYTADQVRNYVRAVLASQQGEKT